LGAIGIAAPFVKPSDLAAVEPVEEAVEEVPEVADGAEVIELTESVDIPAGHPLPDQLYWGYPYGYPGYYWPAPNSLPRYTVWTTTGRTTNASWARIPTTTNFPSVTSVSYTY
jgi:hypothetical protein